MSVMRHREITAQMIRDANGGLSPYPISKIVGNEWLHPDGSITPMTTQPTDPRPAATEAEWESAETHLYSAALGFFDGCGLRLPAETVSVMVDAQLAALKHQGLTIAGAPAFGQVVVDREDAELVMDAAIEYVSEQRARLPNMILDLERNETAVYVDNVDQALDRFTTALKGADR